MTEQHVKASIDDADEHQLEPPRPLMRETPPAEPFPVEALGTVLGDAAKAIHDRVQAPMAIGAQSVLAAATLAVQGHADVELPTGQPRPLSSLLVTVAATGERKSSCDVEALSPITKREKALRDAYDPDHAAWQNGNDAWEATRRQVLADKKNLPDIAAKKAALDNLGPPPTIPLIPMLTCTEPTFEGLARLYANGHPSLGVFSAEGGQFIGGHGMNGENKLRTATALSALWDGEAIKRVRAGDGAMTMPGRRLSMHLMAQPDVASVLLADRMLADQGLLSRVLVTAPEPTSGTRLYHDPMPESAVAMKRYEDRLLDILERPLPLAVGKPNELVPRLIPLTTEARKGWTAFADHVEKQIGPGGDMEPIRGLANKLPEHAARLAGVLALAEDIVAATISGDHLAAGITLAEHYADEALRLFAAGKMDPSLLLAERTRNWLLTKWPEPYISLADLYQRGPNPIRDRKTALTVVSILEEHGWLARVEGGAEIMGQRRREAWKVIRET